MKTPNMSLSSASTENIQFVLDILLEKTKHMPGAQSAYADAVIDFFDLKNRFLVNALIYKKSLNHKLPRYIQKQMLI